MTILLVAATEAELSPLIGQLSLIREENPGLRNFIYKELNVDVLITGVGMVATAFYLGKTLSEKYHCALNFGLAGSFSDNLELGEVVNVVQDYFSELGAEDGPDFLPITEMGLGARNEIINQSQIMNARLEIIPMVSGITVNTVHGEDRSIESVFSRFHPNTESMEGAAFLMACSMMKIPCAQIRAISNKVERRNRNNWKIKEAIQSLNACALEILDGFAEKS